MKKLIVATMLLAAVPAAAQVRQSGTVTQGHGVSWTTSGVVQDAGTALSGNITTFGITNTGTPFCINDGLITASGGYHQLCLGASSGGGGLLSYNAYGGASALPLNVNLNGTVTTLGTGTVDTGTAGQLPYYTAATTIAGNANLNVSSGALTIGQAGSVLGSVALTGSSSGTITIKPQAAAGTWNFNLPITAGTTGQVLTSQGGGSTAMTWETIGGTVNIGSANQAAYYASSTNAVSGTSVLTFSGSTATVSNTLAVTGGISSGVAASSLGSLTLSGNTSGSIIIKPQAAAGSFNFNLPITAGTTGQPLLSAGGGASPMTWGSLAGNTSSFATTSGSLTNGHAAAFDASGNIVDGGTLPTGTINSGTAGQLTYYAGTGSTVSGNANATVSSGALTMGVTGATAGSVVLSGSSTGAITIKGSTTTIGTFNFNLPTTAGTSGGPLLSGGGGAAAMTWGTASGTTTKFGTVTGSLTNGNCLAADASGNLIDNGSPCGSGGSGTVTSGTAGQFAYYASSTNAVASNSSLSISGGAVTVGVPTTTKGTIGLAGNTSGTVTIQPQAAAGTYNFNLPITAGTAGQVLTSQAGGGTAMTWTSGVLTAPSGQSTNFTATANSTYCIDTTGGAVTMTLPASPSNGDTILVLDCKNNFAVTNLTVGRNGNKIMNLSADMTVNTNNANFHLVYYSTDTNWLLY